jgi:hypothetical protein
VFFRQILNEDLSCASYMIADSGEAAVVDPKWETDSLILALHLLGVFNFGPFIRPQLDSCQGVKGRSHTPLSG